MKQHYFTAITPISRKISTAAAAIRIPQGIKDSARLACSSLCCTATSGIMIGTCAFVAMTCSGLDPSLDSVEKWTSLSTAIGACVGGIARFIKPKENLSRSWGAFCETELGIMAFLFGTTALNSTVTPPLLLVGGALLWNGTNEMKRLEEYAPTPNAQASMNPVASKLDLQ